MAKVSGVQGLDKLLRTMQELPEELREKPLQKSLRVGTNVIRDKARSNAPVATGKLARNVMSGRIPVKDLPANMEDGYKVFVRRSFKKKESDPNNAWYWHFVEFGTVRMPAQPFLRPAFESEKNKALQTFANTFRLEVPKAVQKAKA